MPRDHLLGFAVTEDDGSPVKPFPLGLPRRALKVAAEHIHQALEREKPIIEFESGDHTPPVVTGADLACSPDKTVISCFAVPSSLIPDQAAAQKVFTQKRETKKARIVIQPKATVSGVSMLLQAQRAAEPVLSVKKPIPTLQELLAMRKTEEKIAAIPVGEATEIEFGQVWSRIQKAVASAPPRSRMKVRALLVEFGATRCVELDPRDYSAFLSRMVEIGV